MTFASVAVEILAEGSALVALPRGTLALAVARVTLAPGTSLVAGEQTGLALVVIEGGSLVAGGVARGPGAAVILSATEATDLRNAGGELLTVLAISISADDTAMWTTAP